MVTEPVTGREPAGDSSRPAAALVQFYRAFNERDLSLMSENWEQSDDIAMDNPLGGIKRGWAEIGEVYRRIFTGPARVYVEFYDYSLQVSDSMFCAVGRERGTLTHAGETLALAIRTSRVFRKDGERWKQVHHHGSIDNPDLLARYQAAVLGK